MLQINQLIGFGAGGEKAYPTVEFSNKALQSSTADQTVYTFSGIDIGEEHSTRLLVLRIHGGGGSSRTLSSVTANGNACTLITEPTASGEECAIAYVLLPTGTTVEVIVTWSGGYGRCAVQPTVLYGVQNTTPSSSSIRQSSTSSSVSVTGVTGGVVIAATTTGSDVRHTYTNVTESYDQGVESNIGVSGGEALVGADGSISVTSASSSTARELVAAAWR